MVPLFAISSSFSYCRFHQFQLLPVAAVLPLPADAILLMPEVIVSDAATNCSYFGICAVTLLITFFLSATVVVRQLRYDAPDDWSG